MPALARQGEAPVEIRPYVAATDAAFLYSTWLLAAKGGLRRVTVDRLLERPTCRTLVAHVAGVENLIAGYLVTDRLGDRPVIHFGFVKRPLWRSGVMTALVNASGINPNQCILTQALTAADWVQKKFPDIEILRFIS